MKKFNTIALIASISILVSSCEVIGGIFKAGVWSGIIVVVLVIALIIWLLSSMFRGKGNS